VCGFTGFETERAGQMKSVSVTRRAAVGWIAALACGGVFGFEGEREAGDTVEGAVWRMHLTSRARKGLERLAIFRVSDGKIYQKVALKPEVKEEEVGRDEAKGKFGEKTVLNFENLRVFEPGERRGPRGGEKVKGTARINKDEFGKYHGRMVDGDGRHWDLTLTRFKE